MVLVTWVMTVAVLSYGVDSTLAIVVLVMLTLLVIVPVLVLVIVLGVVVLMFVCSKLCFQSPVHLFLVL